MRIINNSKVNQPLKVENQLIICNTGAKNFTHKTMFSKMKDMYKMQKEAKAIKKELASIHVEAESEGVVVVVSAEQELISVNIPESLLTAGSKVEVQNNIVAATKKATKKAQEIAAEKMKGIMGSMGMGM